MNADHPIAYWPSIYYGHGHILEAKCLRGRTLEFVSPSPTGANLSPLWASFPLSVKWELKCLLHKVIRIKWDDTEEALRWFHNAHLIFNKGHTAVLLLMKVTYSKSTNFPSILAENLSKAISKASFPPLPASGCLHLLIQSMADQISYSRCRFPHHHSCL